VPNWVFNVLVGLALIVILVGALVGLALADPPAWVVTIASLALAGATIAGLVLWSALLDRWRARRLARVARRLGFAFTPELPAEQLASLAGLPLFARGRSFARNVLRGEVNGRRVMAMDYEYSTGFGRAATHHRQTVAVLPDGGTELRRELAERLAAEHGYTVEIAERQVAVYRPGWVVRAPAAPAFIKSAADIAARARRM
jgi:hypothetical protein